MDGDWIVRLVNVVAPHSWWDAVFRSFVLLLLINGMDFAVKALVGIAPAPFLIETTITTLIALPFVILIMAVLYHQRRLQQMLSVLATTDMLTGLPNRRDFLARAGATLGEDEGGVLLVLDADHFKRINDRWGHSAGDACLVAIAARLRAALGERAILGRLGGEEFVAFLPSATAEDARRLGEMLCQPIPVGTDGELSVTLSAGAALARSGASLDRLMAEADSALYRAKAAGRARLAIWSGDLDCAA